MLCYSFIFPNQSENLAIKYLTYVYKNTESLDPQVYNPFQLVIASSQIICSVSA